MTVESVGHANMIKLKCTCHHHSWDAGEIWAQSQWSQKKKCTLNKHWFSD